MFLYIYNKLIIMSRIKYKTKDDILKYSLLCNSRNEFRIKYQGAYVTARKRGILNDVCSHMITKSYSTPQLILKEITESIFKTKCKYNDRILIKPFEVDILFIDLKIGFEYDGNQWHKSDSINKVDLCEQKNTLLITLIENNRNYENDIKEQMYQYLDKINKWTGFSISKEDILNIKINYENLIPNLDKIKDVCLKYNNIKEFRLKEKPVYSILQRNKLLKQFTSHMETCRKNYYDLDFNEEIEKYTTLDDLIKNNNPLYLFLKRHNYGYLLDEKFGKTFKWNRALIINEINNYETLSDFKKGTGGCYNAALALGMKDEINKLTKKRKQYDIHEIKNAISKYNTLIDFINNDYNIYNYCYLNNLSFLYDHLYRRKKWDHSELYDIVKTCNTIKELSIKNYNAYTTIRKYHKDLLLGLKRNVR